MWQETLLLISLISNLVLILVLAGIFILYLKLHKKYNGLEKKEKKLNQADVLSRQAKEKAEQILEEAGDSSRNIVLQSNRKAQEIINQAQYFSEKEKQAMKSSLQAIFENVKNESSQVLGSISNDIKEDSLKEIESFRGQMEKGVLEISQALQQMLVDSQKLVNSEIENEKKRILAEIKEYKKARMAQVDKKIYEVVKKVSKEILHHGLKPEEHEEIVLKALEESKKENVF